MAQNDNILSVSDAVLSSPLMATGIGNCNCPSCLAAAANQFNSISNRSQPQVTNIDVSYDYNGGSWRIEGTGMPPARANPDGSFTLDFTQVVQNVSGSTRFHAAPNNAPPILITTTTNNTSAGSASTSWGSGIVPANDLNEQTKDRLQKMRNPGETYSDAVNRILDLLGHLVEKIEDHQTGGCPL